VPAWVVGDPARLRQVLINLLGNALKFTVAGGVHVAVAAKPSPSAPDRVVCLFSVRDTGVGVPDEKKKAIFNPFEQADGSITGNTAARGWAWRFAAGSSR